MDTVLKLTAAHLRMYGRDRQTLFFTLLFPLLMMFALGYLVGGSETAPIELSVVAPPGGAGEVVGALETHPLLAVHRESEEEARAALRDGDRALVVILPSAPVDAALSNDIPLQVLVNASEPQETQQALAILESVLVDVERDIRKTEPLFALSVEDVESRNVRYIDFLVPGLLAFMVMQLSIAGSGFNIVEYKRKGILKRLFVTPLRPLQFIASLIASRLVIVVAQISIILLIAKLAFDITIAGSLPLLYLFVIFGCVLFLGIGFALGGVAKTQNAAMLFGNLVIFPQIFLAGIFFQPDALPAWIQPLAAVLPLNFVSHSIRYVANEGASLAALSMDLVGLAAWTIIGVFLAVRLFHWNEDRNA
jgi:ABC-2 type transport system permease protein